MNINNIDERFRNDAEFNKAVKLIGSIMVHSSLTPLDVRDACYLARYTFEMENPRPIISSTNFEEARDWLNKIK